MDDLDLTGAQLRQKLAGDRTCRPDARRTGAEEYLVLNVTPGWTSRNGGHDANEVLNTFGADGWAIAATVPTFDGSMSLILQRPSS